MIRAALFGASLGALLGAGSRLFLLHVLLGAGGAMFAEWSWERERKGAGE